MTDAAPRPRRSHRLRRTLTVLTLLAGTISLVCAMGFFVLRGENDELAVWLGQGVRAGLVVTVVLGGALALAGVVQAVFGAPPDEPPVA